MDTIKNTKKKRKIVMRRLSEEGLLFGIILIVLSSIYPVFLGIKYLVSNLDGVVSKLLLSFAGIIMGVVILFTVQECNEVKEDKKTKKES